MVLPQALLSLDISLGQGGFRYLLSHMVALDTDPKCYNQGFTYSGAGSIGNQAEIGYQHRRISSVIKSDSRIHIKQIKEENKAA